MCREIKQLTQLRRNVVTCRPSGEHSLKTHLDILREDEFDKDRCIDPLSVGIAVASSALGSSFM